MNYFWLNYIPTFVRKHLDGRYNLLKIINNINWLFFDKVLRLGVGLFVGVWVARYLGPEQFGTYSYALAFVGLFGAVAGLGLDGIVIRDIVRDPSTRDETLGSAFLMKLISGIVTLILTVTAISFLRPNDTLTLWLVGIIAAGTIFQAFDTIDFWFQSQVQSKYTVYARNTAFLLIALTKIALILMKAPLIAFAWAGLVEITLGSMGLVIAYKLNGQYLRKWRWTIAKAKLLLKDSWPLILSGMAIAVYMRIDQVMLGNMAGNKAVGIYNAATRISEIWYFIPMVIVSSAAPSIIEAKKISEELYYQRIEKVFQILAIIALCIAIPVSFLSNYFTNILYGSAFAGSGVVLSIHIWASIFVFLGVAQGPWNLNEGLMKLSLQRTMTGALANVGLNILLIPKFGVIGASIATLISQALSSFLMNLFDNRTHRIFALQLRALIITKYFARISRKSS